VSDSLIRTCEKGITYYAINRLETEEQCELVSKKCASASRFEKLKAAGFTLLAVGLSAAMVSLALTIAKFTAILMALIFLPLAPIVPLYGIIVVGTALVVGGALGYHGVKNIWKFFFEQGQEHWNNSKIYSEQVDRADLKKTEFSKG
jgi:hypothetical protein